MGSLSWKYLVTTFFATLTIAACSAQNTAEPVLTLLVDETQAPRKLAFVHEQIQVHPGKLTLAYPLWIPGEHGPTGPLQQFANLRLNLDPATQLFNGCETRWR
jgi:Peptidase M61 N-terminal domain